MKKKKNELENLQENRVVAGNCEVKIAYGDKTTKEGHDGWHGFMIGQYGQHASIAMDCVETNGIICYF